MATGRKRPLKPAKEQIKDLFSMHTGERRGSVFLIILLSAAGAWAIYEQWFHRPDPPDMEPMRVELQRWMAGKDRIAVPAAAVAEPFPFDPNTIGKDEWLSLGLTERQIDGLQRYMSKGGRFRIKRDLAKMYSIRPEQFARLEPFILLPDSFARKKYEASGTKREWKQGPQWDERPARSREFDRSKPSKVEVNGADTTALIALPGIGPSFARGIVKYRESLGGYVSMDQLAEVYVLKDKPDALIRLRELLVLDTLLVRRIPINTCKVEELAAHPYIRWKLAKPLIAYRQQHGLFSKVADIRGCALIDAETFRKLAPYLSVEQ